MDSFRNKKVILTLILASLLMVVSLWWFNSRSLQYTNEQFGISLSYPAGTTVTEYKDGKSFTVIFENIEKQLGFQIYIVPYGEEKVTMERILLDVPSGISALTNTLLVQKTAVEFNSNDPRLGETKEIWFVHNGNLFEVTTLLSMEDDFKKIISTIKFTD